MRNLSPIRLEMLLDSCYKKEDKTRYHVPISVQFLFWLLIALFLTFRLVLFFTAPWFYDNNELLKGTIAKEVINGKRWSIFDFYSRTQDALNLNSIGHILNVAKKFKAKVVFQPAIQTCLYGEEPNSLAPDAEQYRKVILSLIKLKGSNKFIGKSMLGLKHLFNCLYSLYCGNCWCSSFVELNLFFKFNLSTFINAIRT